MFRCLLKVKEITTDCDFDYYSIFKILYIFIESNLNVLNFNHILDSWFCSVSFKLVSIVQLLFLFYWWIMMILIKHFVSMNTFLVEISFLFWSLSLLTFCWVSCLRLEVSFSILVHVSVFTFVWIKFGILFTIIILTVCFFCCLFILSCGNQQRPKNRKN